LGGGSVLDRLVRTNGCGASVSEKKDGSALMWKTGLWVMFVLLGWGLLSLACDVPPFDPRGYRCSSNADCLQGYTCVANVCELSVPSEETPNAGEGADAGEPTEGNEPKPEASEPTEGNEPRPEASEPTDAAEAMPETERVKETTPEGASDA